MRGKRTYRKEFQFVGSGTIWRIFDAFGVQMAKGKAPSQAEARRIALETERKLPQVPVTKRPEHLKRSWGSMRIYPNDMDQYHA